MQKFITDAVKIGHNEGCFFLFGNFGDCPTGIQEEVSGGPELFRTLQHY